MACTVFSEIFNHALVEFLSVFGHIHVNEIDDDDASHVSESELSGDFVGCSEIHVKCIGLLSFRRFGAITAVDVNHVERFGLFDDEIGSVFVGDAAPEGRFDLFGDRKVVEDGNVSFVEFHDVCTFRGDERDISLHFFKDVTVVDIDILKGWIQQVSKQCHGSACLFVGQEGQFLRLLSCGAHFLDDAFPSFHQHLQLVVQFSHSLSFCHSSDDDAEAVRFDVSHELLETCSLGRRFDFGGYRDFVCEGNEHEETSCEGELTSEARAFCVDGFLDDLNEEFLSDLERVLNAPFSVEVRFFENFLERDILGTIPEQFKIFLKCVIAGSQVKIVQEGVAFKPYVDETSIESGHEFPNLSQVDVADGEVLLACFALEFNQPLVLEQCDGDCLWRDIHNNFACHSELIVRSENVKIIGCSKTIVVRDELFLRGSSSTSCTINHGIRNVPKKVLTCGSVS